MLPNDALKATEVLLASALNLASEASLVSDAQRRTIFCNREFAEMTGYGIDELLGRSCAILQGPGTDPTTVEDIRSALDAGLTYRGSLLNYRRDGTPFWNQLTVSPVRDVEGTIVNFVSVQRDATAKVERSHFANKEQS